MKKDGEDRLLELLKRWEYEDPHDRLHSMLEHLIRSASFLYVTGMRFRVRHGDVEGTSPEPVHFKLSRN